MTDPIEPATVTISVEEYERLLEDSSELQRLYANGVDSWEGFNV